MVNALALPITSVETARLPLRVPELADAQVLMGVFWDQEVVPQKQVTLREPPGASVPVVSEVHSRFHHDVAARVVLQPNGPRVRSLLDFNPL